MRRRSSSQMRFATGEDDLRTNASAPPSRYCLAHPLIVVGAVSTISATSLALSPADLQVGSQARPAVARSRPRPDHRLQRSTRDKEFDMCPRRGAGSPIGKLVGLWVARTCLLQSLRWMTRFPNASPRKRPTNAAGACSNPVIISSRYLTLPALTHAVIWLMNSG